MNEFHDFTVSSIFDLSSNIVCQCLITSELAIKDVNIPKHAKLSIYCLGVNVSSLILRYINERDFQNTKGLHFLSSWQILSICIYKYQTISRACEPRSTAERLWQYTHPFCVFDLRWKVLIIFCQISTGMLIVIRHTEWSK